MPSFDYFLSKTRFRTISCNGTTISPHATHIVYHGMPLNVCPKTENEKETP